MVKYKGKSIFEGDISIGNQCRKEYLDSINSFIENKYAKSLKNRDIFMENVVEKQECYREQFLKMIGEPVSPYPDNVPKAKSQYVGKDDMCDIYYLQIEVMPEFWFYGIYMVPFNVEKTPLVIAQHGGGSNPEICSDFFGESNYSFFTKRALERGMAVFAPQLLLWNFDIDTGEKKLEIDIPFNRVVINNKLRHSGLSITGLEVFCIRRSIDYLTSLDCIDENRIGMMGASYGGYFSLHTAAVDKRIKSIYAACFFNDRSKRCFDDWTYNNAANTFFDAEVAALCAPRRLQLDVGKTDAVFDYSTSISEGERAAKYYGKFNASHNFQFNLWEGGHRFDESGEGFTYFFEEI
ncbi:MAG: acetylxylan esterase [Clostridia bacterium]|nr:acetylxylan esterase [Clostridia bacterium]